MAISLGKLIDLLAPDQPMDVRRSAMTVLSEIGGKEPAVAAAIVEALEAEDVELRIRALRAAGRLQVEKSLPILTERIKGGGVEAELAADAAAHLGVRGTRALREMMHHVAPGLRRYIAAALARTAGSVADLDLLADADPTIVDGAVASLTAAIPTMDKKHRKALADALLKFAGAKKAKPAPAAEAGLIRLAGLLDDPRLQSLLWDRVLPPFAPDVRAQALQAVGRAAGPLSKDQRERLFRCAAEGDFRIAAPALMMLDRQPYTDKMAGEWEPLLRAPDIAVRRVAMAKVGDRDRAEVIDALLEQVRHPDRGYRQEVLAHLGKTTRGRKALVNVLRETEASDEAWSLTKTLTPLAQLDPASWAEELFPAATAYLEAADRRADPLLYVLRESDHAGLRDRLEKRALALTKKGDFETAHLVYRALGRDPAVGFPIRLQIAACGLKVSHKSLERDARANDACLQQFADLAKQDQTAVVDNLAKTKWLEAEDLYYVGFHFAEYLPPMREFGVAVLNLLLKRFPRAKLAAAAKNKLRTTK